MKLALFAAALFSGSALAAAPAISPAEHQAALDILVKSVSFPTVQGRGQVVPYANYLKSVLMAGGYTAGEIEVTPVADAATLIATFPGTNQSLKPIVLLGHMDVVEAIASDWQRDPFKPVVENGYVFGRGALDNKFETSMMIQTLARLRKSGWKPGRTIILALSGDEETAMETTRALAAKLGNAEYVLNGDAGGGELGEDGKPIVYGLQAGEKVYTDFTLTATDPGGHSSRPTATNPITAMSRALVRIAAYQFPPMHNELTIATFKASADQAPPAIGAAMCAYVANPKDEKAIATLSADPAYVGQVRTTCVATMIQGGHAANALPQKVTAKINCRIFPGVTDATVQAALTKAAAEPGITFNIAPSGIIPSDVSPLRPDVMAAVTRAVHARYPSLTIVPSMSSGATDSVFFRALGIPSYGVGGLFIKSSDEFSHGLNERVPVAAIDGALAHWESLLKDLAK